MSMLWLASFRHLLRHPLQLLLALVGLALGVATIVAVDVATGSAARAFELSIAAVQGPATHELDGGPAGIDETLYVHLARTLHYVRAKPVVDGYVTVGDASLQLLGLDPLADAGFGTDDAPTPGVADAGTTLARWLAGDGAALLAAETAARLGVAPQKEALAYVFKTVHQLHGGKLSMARLLAGHLDDGATLLASSGESGRSFSATIWGDADASANSTVPRWTGTMNSSAEIIHAT